MGRGQKLIHFCLAPTGDGHLVNYHRLTALSMERGSRLAEGLPLVVDAFRDRQHHFLPIDTALELFDHIRFVAVSRIPASRLLELLLEAGLIYMNPSGELEEHNMAVVIIASVADGGEAGHIGDGGIPKSGRAGVIGDGSGHLRHIRRSGLKHAGDRPTDRRDEQEAHSGGAQADEDKPGEKAKDYFDCTAHFDLLMRLRLIIPYGQTA